MYWHHIVVVYPVKFASRLAITTFSFFNFTTRFAWKQLQQLVTHLIILAILHFWWITAQLIEQYRNFRCHYCTTYTAILKLLVPLLHNLYSNTETFGAITVQLIEQYRNLYSHYCTTYTAILKLLVPLLHNLYSNTETFGAMTSQLRQEHWNFWQIIFI